MLALLNFIDWLLGTYEFLVFIVVIFSLLIAFNVVNIYHPVARALWDGLSVLVEPVLRRIRAFLPNMGNVDISPIILVIIIEFIRRVIIPNLAYAFLH